MASDMQNGWNFNRYNYAANNPYANRDPDGRACDSLDGGGCGMPRTAPPMNRSEMDQKVGTAALVLGGAVVVGVVGLEVGAVALANPIAARTLLAEIAAGDALGGASVTVGTGVVAAKQVGNIIAETPGGRQLTEHAVSRMTSPPSGRAPMTPAAVDNVLDGATNVLKRTDHPQGATLTIQNRNMRGSPQVVVDEATGNRVITVINPKRKD